MTNRQTPATKPLRGMALLRSLRAEQATSARPKPLHVVLAAQRAKAAEAESAVAS